MMKHSIYLFFCWLVLLFARMPCTGQNLVPNSSFEANREPPTSWQQMGKLEHWYCPIIGSECPSYFMDGFYMPGREINDKVHAHSGKAFLGVAVDLKKGDADVSQYLAVKLAQPLIKDKDYTVSVYIRLTKGVHYGVDHFGVLFENEKQLITGKRTLECKSYLKLKSADSCLCNETAWTLASGMYKARGGEQYLLMGGLTYAYAKTTMPFRLSMVYYATRHITYYYIDDVSVTATGDSAAGIPVPAGEEKRPVPVSAIQKQDPDHIVLSDVTFGVNSTAINPALFPKLDSIVRVLVVPNPSPRVEIKGYTDASGTEPENEKLSEQRAKAIMDYFIAHGVNVTSLSYTGCGSKVPVADNGTAEGRSRNRRVEIRIIRP